MFIIQQSCRLCTRNTRMTLRITRSITPTGVEVKGHPRSLEPRRRYSALALRIGLLIRHPILEVDCRLGINHAPVLSAAGPIFRDVDHCQIQHFEKAVIGSVLLCSLYSASVLLVGNFCPMQGEESCTSIGQILPSGREETCTLSGICRKMRFA